MLTTHNTLYKMQRTKPYFDYFKNANIDTVE